MTLGSHNAPMQFKEPFLGFYEGSIKVIFRNIGDFHARNLFEVFQSLNNRYERGFLHASRYLKGSCLASQWLVRALCKCAGKHEMGLCSRLSIQTQSPENSEEHYER